VIGRDYRELTGTYDRLVSIEMIEAVGWQYFDLFFQRCSELLKPNGLMFLQAITIDERSYEVEKQSKSFINTHIFPGGCLPSLEVVHRCVARETDLTTVWLDDVEIGTQNSLSTPHLHDLSAATPGKHRLTIRVDNRYLLDVGRDAHSVTDHTQTNWNGIVGRIELRATDPVWIDGVRLIPELPRRAVRAEPGVVLHE